MPNNKKKTKVGIFLRRLFKKANLGAFILSLIDLSSLTDDQEVKEIIKGLKSDMKGAKIEINSSNIKDLMYIFSILSKEGVEELADALREAEQEIQEEEG